MKDSIDREWEELQRYAPTLTEILDAEPRERLSQALRDAESACQHEYLTPIARLGCPNGTLCVDCGQEFDFDGNPVESRETQEKASDTRKKWSSAEPAPSAGDSAELWNAIVRGLCGLAMLPDQDWKAFQRWVEHPGPPPQGGSKLYVLAIIRRIRRSIRDGRGRP